MRTNVLGAVALGVVAVAAVAAWRWWAPGPATPAGPLATGASVLLVTIDTLRADRVGVALTPTLEALAARGVRFTNARTTAPLTLPAHASLLTGLLPPRTGVRLNGVHRLSEDTPTLARIMRAHGYRTAAFVGAYVLDRRFGLAQGFETYDDEIPRRDEQAGSLEAERPGNVVADRALAWLQALPADGRPWFLWVHLYDPHAPYEPPPEWLERAHGRAYDGEVAFADAQLGRLLEALRARHGSPSRGGTDEASPLLVVVAGDHGESLGEHGESTHGLLVYEPAVRVPLVVVAPGLPAARRDDHVSLVDVVPTVLGLMGFAAPAHGDGRDLFAAAASRAEAQSYVETEYPTAVGCSPLHALVTDRWKFIGGPSAPELYDLPADPAESRDVASARAATADALSSRVAAILSGAATSAAAPASPEVAERLRALGYVASAPLPTSAPGAAPSPTTIVRAWERFQDAVADLSRGGRARALPVLAELARERPDAAAFQATYAQALADAGQARKALGVYRRALERWPQDTMLLHGYAAAARDAGEPAEAMKAEQAVLAIDPLHAAARNGIGLLHADAGRVADARAAFERAVQLDPRAISYWVNLGNARGASGDPAGAETAYREALRLDPGSPDAANGLGVLLVQAGRAVEAVPVFTRLVAAAPTFYEAWLNLGIAHQQAGSPSRAAEAYRRVLAAPAVSAGQRRAAAELLHSLPR